jgi:DnaJ-class molecular chaperone
MFALGKAAIKHHPDKNRDDPHAEERFKDIAIAYQTLSDPELRKKYNEFGPKETAAEAGAVDPEEVFGAMFGGERFEALIGRISLAHDMKTALQDDAEEDEGTVDRPRDAKGRPILSPEEKAKKDEKERKVAAEVRMRPLSRILRELTWTESGCARRTCSEAGGAPGAQARNICGASKESGGSRGRELLEADM